MSAGKQMRAEMDEQPAALRRLVARLPDDVARLGAVAPAPLRGVQFLARGSSANAALFGRYLVEVAAGRPAGTLLPSVHTLYRADLDLREQLVVAISQSGATPEIATVADQARRGGAAVLAITNDPDSVLARAADASYDLAAGPEIAVPATKTVTAQMFACACLAAALNRDLPPSHDGLPEAIESALATPEAPRRLALRWRDADRILVVARGMGLAAALEGALKIKETTGVEANGISAADLRHGPIAAVSAGTPVLVIDLGGPASEDLGQLVLELSGRGADVATSSLAVDSDLPLPPFRSEPAAAVLAVVRAQQLALELCLARGEDPDRPHSLSKVTLTH